MKRNVDILIEDINDEKTQDATIRKIEIIGRQ